MLTVLRQPPTGLRQATLANVLTDATRLANTQGDGLPFGSGYGVWPAATNLENSAGADVSFETDTTGYTTGGTNTIAADATQAKFGAKSCKATYQDNATLLDIALTLTAAAHSAQRRLWIPTAYDGGGISVQFANFAGATGTAAVAADMGLRDQWQTVNVPNYAPVAGDLAGNIQVVNTGAAPTAGRFVYIDGCQTEASNICTRFTVSPRADAGIAIDPTGLLTPTQGWVAFRLKMGWGVANEALPGGNPPFLLQWLTDGSNNIQVDYEAAGDRFRLLRNGAATSAQTQTAALTFALGDEVTVVVAWDATTLHISFNGGAFVSSAHSSIPSLPATLYLASWGNTRQASSEVRWIGMGRGTLTNADASRINAWGTPVPTLDQIAMLPYAARPTLLLPAKTGDMVLLPAYFEGAH